MTRLPPGQAINKKASLAILVTGGILVNLLYFYFGRILDLNYEIKAPIRLFLFLSTPLLYNFAWLHLSWHDFLKKMTPNRSQIRRLLLTLLIGAAGIAAVNLLILPVCRFLGLMEYISRIVANTQKTSGFIKFVLFYVPLVNALGEEMFFRCGLYLEMADLGHERFATVFSAALFSLYHLSIVKSWFDPPLLAAMLSGLFIAGLFLNHIARRDRHILGVWLIHGLVNFLILSVCLQFTG
jgi:uncharacterized protein